MLYFGACPRCHGDVKYESDVYGRYLECLQCGFLVNSKTDDMHPRKRVSGRGKKVAGNSRRAA